MYLQKILSHRLLFPIMAIFTLLFLLFISFTYFRFATTFSFADEYMNIVAGYFINHGRELYTTIFFHHQLLMPEISAVLQSLLHPATLYKLILYHRLLLICFAFFMNVLLIFRFRYIAIGFILFFELMKYYLFGNLFLAESFIIYPLIYMLGVVWEVLQKKSLSAGDLLLCSIFTCFIVFMREPYILLALVMYGVLLLKTPTKKMRLQSLLLFLLPSLLLLTTINGRDFLFSVVTINATLALPYQVQSTEKMTTIIIAFFYPVFLFLQKEWSFYSVVLTALDGVFLVTIIYLFKKRTYVGHILFLLFLLMLANLRWVLPYVSYYEAFHQIVWFGMFGFSVFLLLSIVKHRNQQLFSFLLVGSCIIFIGALFYPKSYLFEKLDREKSFNENYGKFYTNGKIINTLSTEKDTAFVDYWDTLIFWQAQIDSSYTYALYLPVTSTIPTYRITREHMFQFAPPTFYYADCGKGHTSPYISKKTASKYTQIYYAGKPVCLYVLKNKIKQITPEQREEIKSMGYSLSEK